MKHKVLTVSSLELEYEGSGMFNFELHGTLSEGEGSGEETEKWTKAVIKEDTDEGSGGGLFIEFNIEGTLNFEIEYQVLEESSDNVEKKKEVLEENLDNIDLKNEETADNVEIQDETLVKEKNETSDVTFNNVKAATTTTTTTVSPTENDVDAQLSTTEEHTTLAPFDLEHEQSILDHLTTMLEETFTTLAPIIPGTSDDKTTESLTPTTDNPIATLETPTISSTNKPPVFDTIYHGASENPADKVHEVTYHYEPKYKAAPKASTKAKKDRKSKKHKKLAMQTTTIDPFADEVTVTDPPIEAYAAEIVDSRL